MKCSHSLFRLFASFFLILWLSNFALGQSEIIHSDAYQYLEFLREEQAELDFQLKHKEITHLFYKLASTRLSILRELIINYGRDSQINRMPEYHVVITQELETLIPNGRNKLKVAKPNQIIDERWRFIKTIVKGQTFYLLERLNDIP
ncbi:MAG: hypothetical protein FD167_4118 [bacterium]|nr:MAG: hypothetical protein FD167_4118 [bacterium]